MGIRKSLCVGVLLVPWCLVTGFASDDSVRELGLVWEHSTAAALPQGLAVDPRGLLHIAAKSGGVHILRLGSQGAKPTIAAQVTQAQLGGMEAMHLSLSNQRLYVALGNFFSAKKTPAGLAIIDVSQPTRPSVLDVWKSSTPRKGSAMVVVHDNHAYLGAMSAGVIVLDISNPRQVVQRSVFQPDVNFPRKNPNRVGHPNARGLAWANGHLWVAYDAGGLRVLNVDNPAAPREIGRYINEKMVPKQQAYNNLVIDRGVAYVACDYAGLEILDVRRPASIRQIGWWNPWSADKPTNLWFNSPGHANQIALDKSNRRLYVSAGDSELQVVDVATPRQPRLIAKYGNRKNKHGVWGLALDGNQVYLGYIRAVVPFHGTWSGIRAVSN